jgi:hypothetical protein
MCSVLTECATCRGLDHSMGIGPRYLAISAGRPSQQKELKDGISTSFWASGHLITIGSVDEYLAVSD